MGSALILFAIGDQPFELKTSSLHLFFILLDFLKLLQPQYHGFKNKYIKSLAKLSLFLPVLLKNIWYTSRITLRHMEW